MTPEIKALVALEEGMRPDILGDVLPQSRGISVVDYVEGLAPGQETLRNSTAELVIVACSSKCADAAALVEDSVAQQPDRPVVVLQLDAAESNGFMQHMFAAGADDIIGLESAERVRHALQKAIARKRGAMLAKGALLAPLICVLGPKGGTGKTVTVCNLGIALTEKGHRTVIVDLDLHFGDVGLGLRLTPDRTIYDLARSGGSHELHRRGPGGASGDERIRHRRHARGLPARGHHLDRQLHRGLHGRDARRLLAQGHEAGPGDAGADGLRP
jgi:hypothetical protein